MGWVGGESGVDISGCVSIVCDGCDFLFFFFLLLCMVLLMVFLFFFWFIIIKLC